MTPRRYLSTTLTIDNRDHSTHSEEQHAEIEALRKKYRELKAENAVLKSRVADLENQAAVDGKDADV